jgi:uridine phosphorylase
MTVLKTHLDFAVPPILANKSPGAPSVFAPQALLREARRQKALAPECVPEVCILDPDGDIVRRLRGQGEAEPFDAWPCYHTQLYTFTLAGRRVGIVGCAVGAPFAVLVAEQLFASGCDFLISITSAGQITPVARPPYLVLIERAHRDEGTSYHYLPVSECAAADPVLLARAADAMQREHLPIHVGTSWTTDAPYRETEEAIEAARGRGVLAVEMEAAALYALAAAKGVRILCLAQITNMLGQEGDFEKGEAEGTVDALAALGAIIRADVPLTETRLKPRSPYGER